MREDRSREDRELCEKHNKEKERQKKHFDKRNKTKEKQMEVGVEIILQQQGPQYAVHWIQTHTR